MPAEEFDEAYVRRLAAIERHWWVGGMQGVGAALLGSVGAINDVLDAGCGAGASIRWLASLTTPSPRVTAMDVSSAAVIATKRLSVETGVVQGSITQIPFPAGSFDLVVCADVLQHLTKADASTGTAELHRVVRPGGRVLIRTNSAFGRSDVPERDDWRLYTTGHLREILASAGFVIERLTAANAIGSLWENATRTWSRQTTHQHDGLSIPVQPRQPLNRLLETLLRVEARWLSHPGRRIPFGHTIVAVARRPPTSNDVGSVQGRTVSRRTRPKTS